VYEVDEATLLLVASDRVSAFDVVMREPVPHKGAVLTQMSAFWFARLAPVMPHHCLTADVEEIVSRVPTVAAHREELAGRAMLTRRATPVPFECVVRGYISGSAWAEYKQSGTLAGEPMPEGLVESARLDPPIFSPATKAEQGHDENVTFDHVAAALGRKVAERLRTASLGLYEAGRAYAAERGIIIADTKFEFGIDPDGKLYLIDEALTPDSSRFWPADGYRPGRVQPSFDKQFVRDWLDASGWDHEPPAPELPSEVIERTSTKYREAYELIAAAPFDHYLHLSGVTSGDDAETSAAALERLRREHA
jgi:phosphoribosylaminoimidazole-succinocarboxamide synthase